MENAFHSTGSEDFVEGKEENEDKSQETSCRFLPEDIAPEDELGVPWDDGLVQVEEDGGGAIFHSAELRRL